MLDLDGVVYVGAHAVDGVPALLADARARGMTLAFVTNNAARPSEVVAAHLTDLGVEAAPTDVVTSGQAAAREVAARVEPGARVLVVGGDGLVLPLQELGLVPVTSADDSPAAVVQGFHPSVGWKLLAEASYAIAAGVPWIASNLDLTIPTGRGTAPGNGTLVNVVATAVGRRPDVVAGKPFRPLFDETVRRIASTRPIVVGDRLDTDIEGAVTCGADSLLVMTGVTDVSELCRAEPRRRPSYVAWTMDGLMRLHQTPRRSNDQGSNDQSDDGRSDAESDAPVTWSLSGWRAGVDHGRLAVTAQGSDPDAGLATVTAACWDWLDRQDDPDAARQQLDLSVVDGLWTDR